MLQSKQNTSILPKTEPLSVRTNALGCGDHSQILNARNNALGVLGKAEISRRKPTSADVYKMGNSCCSELKSASSSRPSTEGKPSSRRDATQLCIDESS